MRELRLLGVSLAAAAILFSQTFTGSISGVVTDSSGAVLPKTAITVTDLAKNTNLHTETNDAGFYLVGELPPGSYRVTAEKEGFRKYTLDALPLSTQQKASADIQMEIGTLSDSVSVTAEAQLVESSSSTLGAVVENKIITELPLNGANTWALSGWRPM